METKKCTVCKRRLPKENFSKTRGDCRPCRNFRQTRQAVINAAYVYAYKLKNGCIDCGESNPDKLQFDHRTGTIKLGHIGNMICRRSLETVKKEIDKCDVRCANCHQVKSALEAGYHSKFLPARMVKYGVTFTFES